MYSHFISCGAADHTQGFAHGRQVLLLLSYNPASHLIYYTQVTSPAPSVPSARLWVLPHSERVPGRPSWHSGTAAVASLHLCSGCSLRSSLICASAYIEASYTGPC
jgi:hypothetical protein